MAKDTDWAWAAGFFEGEGCISLSRVRCGGKVKRGYFTGGLEISQKCPEPLEFIQELLEEAGIDSRLREVEFHPGRLTPTLYVSCRPGAQVLQRVLPYIHHPEKIAKMTIYLKMNALMGKQGVKLTEDLVTEREKVWCEWLELREKIRGGA